MQSPWMKGLSKRFLRTENYPNAFITFKMLDEEREKTFREGAWVIKGFGLRNLFDLRFREDFCQKGKPDINEEILKQFKNRFWKTAVVFSWR